MQKLITKYGLAAHLALLAVAPLFLSSTAVLNLAGLALIWIFAEPSRVGDEMLHSARRRVARGIFRDPLFWVLIVVLALSLLQMLNDGVKMEYDAENYQWFLATPALPFLPGSAVGVGYSELALSAVLLVVIMGCRHALGKSARHAFCLVMSTIAGVVALTMAFRYLAGNAAMRDLVACGSEKPVYLGAAFGANLGVAVVALVAIFERHWRLSIPLVIVAISANTLGLFIFAPAFVTLLFALATLAIFVYAFVYVRMRFGNPNEFRFMVVFLASVGLAIGISFATMPASDWAARVAPYAGGDFFTDKFMAARDALSAFSFRVWKESPWLGTGLGSFPVDFGFFAGAGDWKAIPSFQTAPLNGYWMLLVERGTIGAFVLACPLALLIITYILRLVEGVRVSLPSPTAFLCVPLFLAMVLESLFDVTIWSPWMLAIVVPLLALSASSFPKEKKDHGR